MRVGVDLDGCVYDFAASLRQYLVTNCGYDRRQLVPITQWNMWRDWGMTEDEFLAECHRGVDEGVVFTHGEPEPGTWEALQRLLDAGHSLHLVTARDFGRPGLAEAATRQWAHAYLPPVTSLTFTADKTIVRTDVMIDDRVDNYDALEQVGCAPFLMNRPWNVHAMPDGRHRVDSMTEFADAVLNAVVVRV